ncbi:redoxin [Xylanimonas oleitrophica]|uniref:Redoxin n=1 Tax=Xylanimonas oleitrophica TaxID=2607479 RepID=A0A2W5WJH2_9MICO|nr:peroxiredoxin family protein [Xylanimonas oleitrophica]PZR51669.1 redoxin [Xylanimonas oleitrophica]
MTTASMGRSTKAQRKAALAQVKAEQAAQARRTRTRRTLLWAVAVLVLAGVVTFGLLSARPATTEAGRPAPEFTLPASDGSTVSLADYHGKAVVLYFNEGAGCDACIQQMAEIEKDPNFAAAGITVLPIVMNTAEQINPERERFDISTPFLIDDGTVSAEYGTLGTGMHEGLPGHGFVLIGPDGTQLWKGDYPSMWLAPDDLYSEVKSRL